MPPKNLDLLKNQYQYPGMTYVESRIAEAWIRKHGFEYDEIIFNVRLGDGVDPGEGYDAATRSAALQLSQKRADIVARSGSTVDLIEAKVRIAFNVIGQLLGYRSLYVRDFPDQQVRKLIAIGRSVVPDAQHALSEHGIAVETFDRVPLS